VGYAANPNKVIDLLRTLKPLIAIRGNHDKVVAGIESGENFNVSAQMAALWSRQQITAYNQNFLRNLPSGPIVVDECFQIVHGHPDEEDFYIFREQDVRAVLNGSKQWITFFGHTHFPIIYIQNLSNFSEEYPDSDNYCCSLSRDKKYLINPGSVGQPRDSNPKASFAIFDSDTDTIEIKRIEYDIHSTQEKIQNAGLPEYLASRLLLGR
jgi:diadenosine tetraphosphatase ApaH/serine/threonine PP2A family protein phosphatase